MSKQRVTDGERGPPRWRRLIETEKLRLSTGRAPVVMAVLGMLTGLVAGAVVIAFRLLYESGQLALLPGGLEDFEGLPGWQRVVLAVAGAGIIGLYMQHFARRDPRTGIGFVIERTAYHEAMLPLRNAIHQFITGSLAIASGQSVGREGPSVHMGATAGSQLGQWLGLPHNSLRTLVACGTAAAIGASFNTPLAGVAFAMEVVVMEYTIAGFLPVMIAAVTATAMAHLVFGSDIAFSIPALTIQGIHELPLVILLGLLLGGLAAAFIRSLHFTSGLLHGWPAVLRTMLGGLVVGVLALFVPQIMGIGYDTVAAALAGEIGAGLLLAIVAAKLIGTAAVLGLGVPGGLVGPTLIMGATAGGAVGMLAESLISPAFGGPALYALLGMGAMMGATLRAPLAALTAMLELTGNPGIIMPGMLAIAAGTLSARELFRTDSVYHLAMGERGLDPRRNPMLQAASRLGILQLVDQDFRRLPARSDDAGLNAILDDPPRWILDGDDDLPSLVCGSEAVLANRAAGRPAMAGAARLTPIDERASLREAIERLRASEGDILLVIRTEATGPERCAGVVSREAIQSAYLS